MDSKTAEGLGIAIGAIIVLIIGLAIQLGIFYLIALGLIWAFDIAIVPIKLAIGMWLVKIVLSLAVRK